MLKKNKAFDATFLATTKKIRQSRIVIIKTSWNAEIVNAIEEKCMHVLRQYQFLNIVSFEVPGAVEIPFLVKQIWEHKKNTKEKPSIFIAIGCVIKGDTPHFDFVCNMVSQSIAQLNMSINAPTIMGILTVNNLSQALERIKPKQHKGEEFANAAIQMLLLQNGLKR